jgi:hypothetical protein
VTIREMVEELLEMDGDLTAEEAELVEELSRTLDAGGTMTAQDAIRIRQIYDRYLADEEEESDGEEE